MPASGAQGVASQSGLPRSRVFANNGGNGMLSLADLKGKTYPRSTPWQRDMPSSYLTCPSATTPVQATIRSSAPACRRALACAWGEEAICCFPLPLCGRDGTCRQHQPRCSQGPPSNGPCALRRRSRTLLRPLLGEATSSQRATRLAKAGVGKPRG